MKDIDKVTLSADDWDELTFPRSEENDFDGVVERAISRRGFLGGVLAFGLAPQAITGHRSAIKKLHNPQIPAPSCEGT